MALRRRRRVPLDGRRREQHDLVVGLTLEQLESRFHRLRRADGADYQHFFSGREYLGRDMRWLGDSQWAVVIENGRARALHLMKGL